MAAEIHAPDPGRRSEILDARFATQVGTGLDARGIVTWDPNLSRRTRILVPVDVQAYVVPAGGTEVTVPVTGGKGDPAPFAAGSVRPAGVHLHWALPDALLTGAHSPQTQSLALPVLPDRWVVVRTLQEAGARAVTATGWVIDAKTASVTPLSAYTGTPAAAPTGAPVLDPLDGASSGLMWTASYTAAAGRFGFHDPLTDLGPAGPIESDQAVYTVAGWWSDLAADPLAGAHGPAQLDASLAALDWHVTHDTDGKTASVPAATTQFRANTGLPSPEDSEPVQILGADGTLSSTPLKSSIFRLSVPVADLGELVIADPLPRYATLVHGSVLGVPVRGALPPADDRPDPSAVGVAIGQDTDDVAAAFGSAVLTLDPAHRASAETLLAAFTSGLLDRLATPDGLVDLAEREHGDGFWAVAGAPVPAMKTDRLRAADSAPMGPLTVGRKGRAANPDPRLGTRLTWKDKGLTLRESVKGAAPGGSGASSRTGEIVDSGGPAPGGKQQSQSREVTKPAPRAYRPQPPMIALRGVHPNHRHHGDGLYDDSGRLLCRFPAECVTEITGIASGATVLPTLGSGAIPDEVVVVVREAVLINPYGYRWIASAAAATANAAVGPYSARLGAEMVRLYGADGVYDGSSHLDLGKQAAAANGQVGTSGAWSAMSAATGLVDRQIAQEMARHSLLAGLVPSPVAVTTWRQPWVPLWVEWQVTLDGHDTAAGWTLGDLDLQPPPGTTGTAVNRTLVGRSALGQGVSKALHDGIARWIRAEQQRTAGGGATLSPADDGTLASLGDLLVPLDLMSASLDGIREQLLGIPYVGVIDRGTGTDAKPPATGLPVPLFGGTLTLDSLRLVDAFGRTLDVPTAAVTGAVTTTDLQVPDPGKGIWLRPRIQHQARWLFRLVDPGQPADTPVDSLREAYVDQLDPAGAVNPVAGFLLPDHIDEELEAFTVAGDPIGALGHDAVSGAVTWEPAPGRPVPPDAGPLAALDAQARITGQIAAGLVAADAAARNSASPPAASALSALLRAIDTTLWTVDTFSAVGSPTIAGLVGRPVAIVRAVLRLDAPDDLAEVTVTADGGAPARAAAFAALSEQRFTVKLGTLTRTDDAVLGFYVDDDYAHLHLVDRVVATDAIDSGRHRGQLGLLGAVTVPGVDPLDHPYLIPDGTLSIRVGQTVRLTLLMLPVGRVHLTSGILPRKQLALVDDWVTPGLRRLVPSVRVGPVLVDPGEIRLPLVNLLGDTQTFTRRTGPLTWKDDPILAATETAYLPRLPHEVQEGWIRVTPDSGSGTADGTEGATA